MEKLDIYEKTIIFMENYENMKNEMLIFSLEKLMFGIANIFFLSDF